MASRNRIDEEDAYRIAEERILKALQSNARSLDLGGLGLMTLPPEIGNLTGLTGLSLFDNQFTALPESLRGLKTLTELYLHGNDPLGIPPEVLGPTWREVVSGKSPAKPADILDYYFRIRAARRPLNEAKLILVGRGGVGKTSLVNRLLFNRFDKDEKKTEGIRISGWKLRLRGSEDVRLNLWDFGGQEIMHATHQFFLTQRSLYLLVLEGRQGAEDADAEYWLKLIESFGAESEDEVSPVIVVLNKSAENPFDLNRRALRQKYPFIRDFIATDCAEGAGMNELRTAIDRETDQLKHLRAAFPASWFTVKDALSKLTEGRVRKSFLTFDEYRALCAEHGEKDHGAQDSLATHLHNLGIALNYKDDPRLRDMHVLNPHWVTNGIYKILNSPLLNRQNGEIRLGDAAQILNPPEYPRNMHRFLFDLMKKFQLCFSYPDDDTHYLIPELLDKQEADEAAQFNPTECLNFEYRYPILPEGLLPRFIVRTHGLSTGLPRWRTGVILAFEGNRALVKADVQDKRVFIAVSGPAAGRRRLLAVIRSNFDGIHGDISKLRPEAMVPIPGKPQVVVRYTKLLALEEKGIASFHEELNNDVIELNVKELLDGIETLVERNTRRARGSGQKEVTMIFQNGAHAHFEGDTMENVGGDKNTQTISGGTFNQCAIANRQTLENCFNTIQQVQNPELKASLEELHAQVGTLLSKLDAKNETTLATETRENLDLLVKEATKSKPRKKLFEVSSEGLIEAAKTLKEMTGPIVSVVTTLGKLLFS